MTQTPVHLRLDIDQLSAEMRRLEDQLTTKRKEIQRLRALANEETLAARGSDAGIDVTTSIIGVVLPDRQSTSGDDRPGYEVPRVRDAHLA